jgi:hypothetical protein
MKYFVLVMLLLTGPVYAETKTQVPAPQQEKLAAPPGWILCMNPQIARLSSACRMFVWDGPAPVLGATK